MINETLKFAEDTFRLMYLIRYNIYPRVNNETVASHVSQVALLTLFLGEQLKNKYKLNIEKMLKMAITHDLAESEGMDIVHSLKEKYSELKKLSLNIELEVTETLLGKEYRDLISEYETGNTIESIIVEIADVISCVIYSKEEIKLGNTYFNKVLKESEYRLNELIDKLSEVKNKNGRK